MTLAADAPPLVLESLEQAVDALRAKGMRVSTARRLVLDALFAADGPVSAVRLARQLSLDAASVYRNLEVFERYGLVRHVHLGHGPGLYVLFSAGEVEYLYCERCARVTPLAPDELDPLRAVVRERFGYRVRFTHFALVGECAECAARPRTERGIERERDARPGRTDMHSHGDHVHSHPRGGG